MALLIFAFAAAVLGSAYVNVLNAYEVAARSVLTNEDFAFARQIVLSEPDRKKLERGGDFTTGDGRQVRWTAEFASTAMPDVFTVTLSCEVPDPGRGEPVRSTQSFTLLRPTWSVDAAERGKLKEEVKARIAELQSKLQSSIGRADLKGGRR